jgi:hypothetical protein
MFEKTLTLFAFGKSRGDYDWPGGAPGGLLSLRKNKITEELFLISTSPEYGDDLKPLDFWSTSIYPAEEKMGIFLRKITAYFVPSIQIYRNSLIEAHAVHAELVEIALKKEMGKWGQYIPDPIPHEGLSNNAKKIMFEKGLNEELIRNRFNYCPKEDSKKDTEQFSLHSLEIYQQDTDLLKIEIKALKHELAELKSLKLEIEKDIKDFASKYDEELGDLLLKLLELRSKISEAANGRNNPSDNPTPETKEYQSYKENLDSSQYESSPTLTADEQAEIKKAFRLASKLCHPDIASPSDKEKANEIFVRLQHAYERNDLKSVLEILRNLQNNGLDIDTDVSYLDETNFNQVIDTLKSEIYSIRNEIKKLQASETYKVACSTKDIDSYFNIKKIEIEKEIQMLLSKNGDSQK